MAILKLGPLVTDIRGPIAATVFKRTRAGPVAQRRTGARALGSTAQLTIRATVARLASIWRGFDTAARAKWIRYAAAMKIRTPPPRLPGLAKPFNLFMAYNVPSVALGAAVQEAPPTYVRFCPPSKSNMGMVGYTQFAVGFAVDPLLSNESALIYASRPFPKSQTNPRTWTWRTYRTVGPKSIDVFYPLPRAISTAAYIRIKIVRHSTVALDSLPRFVQLSYPP